MMLIFTEDTNFTRSDFWNQLHHNYVIMPLEIKSISIIKMWKWFTKYAFFISLSVMVLNT